MIIQHRRGKTADWKKADILAEQPENIAVILKNGEFAIEELEDGSRHIRIGDGSSKFFDSPYIDARAEAVALEADIVIQRSIDGLSEEHENTKKSLNELAERVTAITSDYETAVNVDSKLSVINSNIATLREEFQDDSEAKNTTISELSAKQTSIESDLASHMALNIEQFSEIDQELLTLSENFKNRVNSLLATIDAQKIVADEAFAANTVAHEQISKAINDLKAALETADQALAASIAQLDAKDTAAIHGLQDALTPLKADVQQLTSDSAQHTDQLNNINTNINQLSEGLASLTTNLDTTVSGLSAEISAVESAQQASDKAITETVQQHVSDINKSLSELSVIDAALCSDLSALTSDIGEIKAEQEATETKIAELVLVDASLDAKIKAVESKITAPITVETENTELPGTNFISGIRKDGDKVIATQASLPVATTTIAGITSVGAEGGAASFKQAKENAEEITRIKSAISELETNTLPVNELVEWRDGLEVADTKIVGQFLTSVSQVDGKIVVTRAQPSATDIVYGDSTIDVELSKHATAFDSFTAKSVQINEVDNTLHIGNDVDNSVIFYCGNATDL
jgi:hypothetical protein